MPHNGAGGEEEIQTLRLVVSRLEHELRSPLQAVVGFARLLSMRVPSDLSELATRLCAGADQLTDLVDELSVQWVSLDSSDPSTGAVREAVERSVSMVHLPAGERHVEVVVDAAMPDQPVPAALGVARLTQVLTNLLTNAVKFAPEGTQVVLSVRPFNDGWVFVVEDRGPGVTPGDQDRIFEPFVRGGTRPGSGLGLYVVRTLVEGAGGTVRVERVTSAGGARFTVVVPHTAT